MAHIAEFKSLVRTPTRICTLISIKRHATPMRLASIYLKVELFGSVVHMMVENRILLFFEKRANIPHNKTAIGDLGYRGDLKVSVPNEHDSRSVNKFKRRARARHEDLNQILKSFYVLSGKFRHGCREKHQIVFEAVTVLVQYSLEDDRKLLEI
jgi:hypothetical protein